MTPVKLVRPAEEHEEARLLRRRGKPGKFSQLADSILPILKEGKPAVVELTLEEGEKSALYRSGIFMALKRRRENIEVRQLTPVDNQPENEVHLLIRKGRDRE